MKVLKNLLSLTITCPQISGQRQFIEYQDGHWATLKINNQTSLLPVNKKDSVVELKTKLHCESFYYSYGDSFKNVTPLHGKVSLKELPFSLNAYKLPSPATLVVSSSPTRAFFPSVFYAVLPPYSPNPDNCCY